MKFLTGLKGTLISTFLLLAGIFFLMPVLVPQLSEKIKVYSKRRNTFITIGFVLLALGISLYLLPRLVEGFGAASPPTIMGVTIRTSHEGGELVYYQEVKFYDEDGNTNMVEWNLVDLSDPSQRQYIDIQNSPVDVPPAVQKIRSTATGIWHCKGRIYVATLEASLVDRDGNRSKPVRYTIDCK